MNRKGAEENNKLKLKIMGEAEEISKSKREVRESVAKKLTGMNTYDEEDIKTQAQDLLKKFGHRYDQQFFFVESIAHFDKVFIKMKVEEEIPKFVIFGKRRKRWVLFCLIQHPAGTNLVLFRDPCGAFVSFQLAEKLKVRIPHVEIVENIRKDPVDDKSYGPITFRNLEVMLRLYNTNWKTFIEQFAQIEFVRSNDFTGVLTHSIKRRNNITELTGNLATNDEFKNVLKEFVNDLPLESVSSVMEYKMVIEEELENDEEDIEIERIEEARKNYLNEENIKKYQDKSYLITNDNEYELEMKQKFPNELQNLHQLFSSIETIKRGENFNNLLQTICDALDVDYERVKRIYEIKIEPKVSKKKTFASKLSPDSIVHISVNLPSIKNYETSNHLPLEELLAKIKFGPQSQIDEIKAKYHAVKNNFNDWKSSTIQDINTWAKQNKGVLGDTDDAICETISVMDRAFNLLTGGHHLRDVQILAILIFFHKQERGRFCQIKPGEGKRVIISLLAVIRALQGNQVDVITVGSFSDDIKRFYSTFDLTVSTNRKLNPDILYGTINNFQSHYLKETFERPFGQVILDGINSMVVDGTNMATIATSFPGMETLKYVFIKIWTELHRAEESFIVETQDEILTMSNKKIAKKKCDKFLQEKISSHRNIIKDKITNNDFGNIPVILPHLKNYVTNNLDKWIDKALQAKYDCHENQQYRISIDNEGEKCVTTVNYQNGITLTDPEWSHGLLQFLQLKHNLQLTSETLPTAYISNIKYLQNYDPNKIFGLTDTLGSEAEQEFLSEIYNIDYAKLPTFANQQFVEFPGLICPDDKWAIELTLKITEKIDDGRAVLALLETEEDLLTIQKNLKLLQYNSKINSKDPEKTLRVGEIILATNRAGRSLNYLTEEKLETNGGLHVCVGFLPANLRDEGEAFGRTSRHGNKGSAQLIIRQSEIEKIGKFYLNPNFQTIRKKRDGLEKERLGKIKASLEEINFKDEIFSNFSKFYRKMKGDLFLLQDLKEFWAFWINGNVYTNKKNSVDEFDRFLEAAEKIISGKISHNPIYCIALADDYIERNELAKASEHLQSAIEMSGEGNLPGAHIKLFEILLTSGEQLKDKFQDAVKDIFSIKYDKKSDYLIQAELELTNAKEAISKETNYIKTLDEDLQKIITDKKKDNLLLKHLCSRYYFLELHLRNINYLISQLEKSSEGMAINLKVRASIDDFKQMTAESPIVQTLSNAELSELKATGIDVVYTLNEIESIHQSKFDVARARLSAGMLFLGCGLAWHSSIPVVIYQAPALISDAIFDIVVELLGHDNSNLYVKAQFISYAIESVNFRSSIATQLLEILSRTMNLCRKMPSFLHKNERLQELSDGIEIGWARRDTGTQLYIEFEERDEISEQIVLAPLLSTVFQKDIDRTKETLEKSLAELIETHTEVIEKLKTVPKDQIDKTVQDFLNTEGKDEAEKIGHVVLKGLENAEVAALVLIDNPISKFVDFDKSKEEFVANLLEKLEGEGSDNEVSAIIEGICSQMAETTISIISEILKSHLKGMKVGEIWNLRVAKKDNEENDPYQILNVKTSASILEVRTQFLKIASKFDKKRLDSDENKKFKRLLDAYRTVVRNIKTK